MPTPKEKVQKRYPDAHCNNEGRDGYAVYPVPFGPMRVRELARAKSPAAAWKAAAQVFG